MNNRYDDEEDETSTFPPIVLVHVVVEQESEEKSGGPRPNAYWQRVREEAEGELEPDTFGGGFRGVPPAPHGGSINVTPDQVIGADDLCWCGLPAGHDWPGKDKGRKHPKGNAVNTRAADTVDRRDLRAYHARLQDFILQCVNEDGLRFRLGKNSTILYPPDGTNPATVYARNTDRQVKQLQKWYVAHIYPHKAAEEVEPVEPEQVEALAKVVNDPVEHPAKEPFRPTKKVSDGPMRKQEEPPVAPPVEPEAEAEPEETEKRETTLERQARQARNHILTPDEWRPYERESGPAPYIETDGKWVRCTLCIDTDHPLLSENARSIGGHNRIYHTDSSTMHSPEARAKATATSRARKARARVEEAIDLLYTALGEKSPASQIKHLTKQVADLERANEELAAQVRQIPQVENWHAELVEATRRADEAEARLALMREALTA